MPISKYAYKQAIKRLADLYTEEDWQLLCSLPAFLEMIPNDRLFNVAIIQEQADKLLKEHRAKTAIRPVKIWNRKPVVAKSSVILPPEECWAAAKTILAATMDKNDAV